jgi:hypothetical protein
MPLPEVDPPVEIERTSPVATLENCAPSARSYHPLAPLVSRDPMRDPVTVPVADNELSWVSASQPGSSHVFNEPAIPAKADYKTTEFSFSGHKSTEQTQVLS